MRLSVERVDAGHPELDEFVRARVDQETPFVVGRVSSFDGERLTPEYAKERFTREGRRQIGWYDCPLVDDEDIRVPNFVRRVLERWDMSVRKEPMRVFLQPGGHVTLPHYDGNSLHGMNMQVLGRKRWVLTSPRTPLPTMPFMFAGLVKRNFAYDAGRYDIMDFETHPGDLLFLPRYWYHEVHSLGEVNLNVNWVFTPLAPNEEHSLGRREVELLKLRAMLPVVDRNFPDKMDEYGGRGPEITRRYTSNVTRRRALLRLVREALMVPRLLAHHAELRSRAEEFSRHNFGV